MKKALKIVKIFLISYLLYFLIFGILIYKIPYYKKNNLSYDINDIKSSTSDDNYALIVESQKEALDVRIALINEATTSINLLYYNFGSDTIGEILAGLLIKKADEGVKVNIIIDNKFFIKSKMMKTLAANTNINLYKFEKKNLLIPTSLHNSLHDKFITIDDKYGLIGGRNILDRFFFAETKNPTNDRDVLVFSKNGNNNSVKEMNKYTDELISSRLTTKVRAKNKNYQNIYYQTSLKFTDQDYHFDKTLAEAIKVDNITFVRSPLHRFNKEPVLFKVINELAKDSDKIVIQSPYIVSSRSMIREFAAPHNNITFITNNMNTNPNLLATSGYLRIRNKLAKNYTLYEIQEGFGNHAKSISIDDNISIIGSQNIDPRSFYLSTESAVIIISEEFNAKLNQNFTDIINKSLLVNEDGKYESNPLVNEAPPKTFKKIGLYIISGLSALFNEMLIKVNNLKLF